MHSSRTFNGLPNGAQPNGPRGVDAASAIIEQSPEQLRLCWIREALQHSFVTWRGRCVRLFEQRQHRPIPHSCAAYLVAGLSEAKIPWLRTSSRSMEESCIQVLYADGTTCRACNKQFFANHRLLVHLRDCPSCCDAISGMGMQLKEVGPGIGIATWNRECDAHFTLCPPTAGHRLDVTSSLERHCKMALKCSEFSRDL